MPISTISPTQPPDLLTPTTQEDVEQNEDHDSFFDYNQARLRINNLIQSWIAEIDNTRTRRNMRYIDVDLLQLYKEGKLKSDETFIPIRVIDTSIKHELPSYISFLTQSRRLAIFSCVDNPGQDTNLIEQAFTRGMMYSGWQLPLYKCVDGALTHGWDSVEVEYREDRPLKCNIDHVGHENLLFARDARDIEACELVLRRYELTVAQIKRFQKKYSWDYAQCYATYSKMDVAKEYQNVILYKGMFKWDGIVHVFWIGGSTECTDWIKEPMPLSLGREKTEEYMDIEDQPMSIDDPTAPGQTINFNLPTPVKKTRQVPDFETQYPFKILCYSETEQQAITDYKGRCFLDGAKQEAQTALWSVLVNGSVRASNVYGSPKNADNTGQAIKKLDIQLEHGSMYNIPIEFWHTEYPDPNIVRVSDGLETRTQIETGQPAFAVNNRQDSRKTATENQIAQQQQSMMSGVSVTLFSVFMQKLLSHCWILAQAQALQGAIRLLDDMASVALTYDIRSAGDVDVVQRADKLNRRMTYWPIVSQTPLAQTFLADMLTEGFPEDAARYQQVMQQMAAQQNQVAVLGNIIQHIVLDDNGQIKPEFKQYEPQLQQLKQQLTGGQPSV